MATLHGTLPPAMPSTSQASNLNSQDESSAARCCALRMNKLKQLKDAKLGKGQAQPEYTQVQYSVDFTFSAGGPIPDVSRPATNPASQTGLATQVYGRNAVRYLHYLQKKIKLLISNVDSHHQTLDSIIKLVLRKINSYREILKDRLLTIYDENVSCDKLDKFFMKINAKRVAFKEDLKRRIDLLYAKQASYDQDIRANTDLLNSKLGPFSQDLDMQRKLLDSKTASHAQDLEKKIRNLRSCHRKFVRDFKGKIFYLDQFREWS